MPQKILHCLNKSNKLQINPRDRRRLVVFSCSSKPHTAINCAAAAWRVFFKAPHGYKLCRRLLACSLHALHGKKLWRRWLAWKTLIRSSTPRFVLFDAAQVACKTFTTLKTPCRRKYCVYTSSNFMTPQNIACKTLCNKKIKYSFQENWFVLTRPPGLKVSSLLNSGLALLISLKHWKIQQNQLLLQSTNLTSSTWKCL